MTETPDNQDTRPISVAELLARNGNIGSPPPVGGRRRRRRGNTESVTVAELTGEIPVFADGPPQVADAAPNGTTEPTAEPEDEAQAEAELPDLAEQSGSADAADLVASLTDETEVSAEEMAPDPVDLDDEETEIALEDQDEAAEDDEPDPLPAYLQTSPGSLFGGRSSHDQMFFGDEVATELPEVPPQTTTAADHEDVEPPTGLEKLARSSLVVLQSILAVAFGAGLFIGFDQLWKWNTIVALVLSVLVILGLVAAVWVVRKTEDIASTLIAVAVGALVTMGPLVLHAH